MGDVDRNRVLVVGAGPCGLRYDYHHINRQKVTMLIDEVPILLDKRLTKKSRTAIEAHLLGARTVVIERRPKFTRSVKVGGSYI